VRLLYIVLKDLRVIGRERATAVSMLILPLIVITLVASVEGDRPSILLAVVNDDHGRVADALLRVLREHLTVQETDRQNAERLVKVENSAAAALILPPGMSERFLKDQPSAVELLTDPAQSRDLGAIRVIFLLAKRDAAAIDDPFAEKLLTMQERSLTTRQLDIPRLDQRVPGLTVMFVLMNMVFSIPLGLWEEEMHGTDRRLAVAPVSYATVLSAKLLARVLLGTMQLLLLLLFGHVMYGLTLGTSTVAMPLIAVCSVFAMASCALAVATVVHTRERIIPIGLAVTFTLASVGGCWWPFFNQPHWLQLIGRGLMTTWSMLAIHDVMLRNKTALEVVPKLTVLIGQGMLWLAVALVATRRRAAGM
jgi:linearmycin/streptolysin S transport system permease protein